MAKPATDVMSTMEDFMSAIAEGLRAEDIEGVERVFAIGLERHGEALDDYIRCNCPDEVRMLLIELMLKSVSLSGLLGLEGN